MKVKAVAVPDAYIRRFKRFHAQVSLPHKPIAKELSIICVTDCYRPAEAR